MIRSAVRAHHEKRMIILLSEKSWDEMIYLTEGSLQFIVF